MDQTLLSTLKKNKLFLGIDSVIIEKLSENSESFFLNEGKILFRRGDQIEFVYLVQNGEINHFIEKSPGNSLVIAYANNDFIISPELTSDISPLNTDSINDDSSTRYKSPKMIGSSL